jgi:hypoxanthine phosphoribosyltransferase
MNDTVTAHDKRFKIYIPEGDIRERVRSIAERINTDFEGKNPLFIAVLNGAFMFAADLFKHITIDCSITFIKLASYNGHQTTGKVRSLIGLQEDVAGRHVVIVEDIVDTGITINEIRGILTQKEPASIHVASMLLKPDALQHDIEVDYIGFKVPNDFLLGYGLDYGGLGRNLPAIYHMLTSS